MRFWMGTALVTGALGCTESDRVEWQGAEFSATIDAKGVVFAPEAGPQWSWRLESVEIDGTIWGAVEIEAHEFTGSDGQHDIDHGVLVERYVAHDDHVSQQFYLHDDPGGDLVIRGAIATVGQLAETRGGWTWTRPDGAGVFLGDVTVFDANGVVLPAWMDVDVASTAIHVAKEVLAEAAYPIWIDPEIGPDDFAISMAPAGDEAEDSAVATSLTRDRHLVVWTQRTPGSSPDRENYGRLVTSNGTAFGNDVRLTTTAGENDGFGASNPAVAWNSNADEFLVVFGARSASGFDIYARRIGAADGAPIDAAVLVSSGNPGLFTLESDVVYNPFTNDYAVVWVEAASVADEREIYFRRIDGMGNPFGATVKVSEQGPSGDPDFRVQSPAIAYNATDNQHLVVWSGSDPALRTRFDIYGQRLAADGTTLGANIKISAQGQPGMDDQNAFEPDVAWGSATNRFLVTWSGDSVLDGLVDGEFEIYGQLLNGDGTETNPEFRISDVRGTGDSAFGAESPAVAYDAQQNEFVVVWQGTGDRPTQVSGEFEIYAQAVSDAGLLRRSPDVITNVGTDGDASLVATDPAVSIVGSLALVTYSTNDPSEQIEGQLWTGAPNDLDGDGFTLLDGDCNDLDATIFPGAPEACGDAIDSNCDGVVALLGEFDLDGDGLASCEGDCNDLDPTVFTGAPELCDGIDNDCDLVPDDGAPDQDNDFICDAFDPCPQDPGNDFDGDGVCDSADLCEGNDAFGDTDDDNLCDDIDTCPLDAGNDSDFDGSCDSDDVCVGDDATGDPDGDGLCNNIDPCPADPDNDADADGSCAGADLCVGNDTTGDADSDGYCADQDCDETRSTVFPGAPELCDGLDNACTGVLPNEDTDLDGDGIAICGGDCDDDDATRFAGADEICDGIDNDCDGTVPTDEIDADGDGFATCDGDCDPLDATAFPGAEELCDGIDNDCDGEAEVDDDADGFLACEECDDTELLVNPSSYEICGDGIDNDCDDATDEADCVGADETPSGGCSTGGGAASWLALLALTGLLRRRR